MDIKQRQKLSQRLALSPQMKQSLRLLQLPLLELKTYLETQVEENPVLEHKAAEKRLEESFSEEKIKKILSLSEKHTEGSDYNSPVDGLDGLQKRQRYRESIITKEPSLYDHLLRQLRMHRLTPRTSIIGEHIIADIDENGYLRSSTEELQAQLKGHPALGEKKITKQEFEDVLALIQTFDPAGIAAKNLKECLLLQLKAANRGHSLAYHIVSHHLVDIAKKKKSEIAKKLKKSLPEIEKALREIAGLEPKPGQAFSSHQPLDAKSNLPDVIVQKNEGKFEIIVNTVWLPTISINKQYKRLLQSQTTADHLKQYLRQKIKAATWLIKALKQRDETIRKIAQCIATIQADFLESGDLSHLKPLTLKQVAQQVQRNESTVSRVVNSKYIHTPVGTFKLNSFFSTHLATSSGEHISSERIKSFIAEIIAEEQPCRPLRDNTIAKMLQARGIRIARRTIAKYREELKVPAYHRRKK